MAASSTESLPYHPAAGIFQLFEVGSDEMNKLVESIRKHGLIESIKTHDGKILDGRNRLVACRLAGVAPRFDAAKINGSAVDYVWAVNDDRRHSTPGARELAAGKYKIEKASEEAKERQKAAGGDKKSDKAKSVAARTAASDTRAPDARTRAAEKFDVKPKAVDAATKVLTHGSPQLIKAVECGHVRISTAARLSQAPKAVQEAAVKEGQAAIRAAIEKHVPSPSEEARNDPGVLFHKSTRQILTRIISTRELGGILQLTARWTPDLIEQYRDDISDLIQELETWKAALTDKLKKR